MARMANRQMKKPPAPVGSGGRRLGVLPLMYLDGRLLPDTSWCLSRRETEDSNLGHPRLKSAAGLEPAGLANPDAYANYRALSATRSR